MKKARKFFMAATLSICTLFFVSCSESFWSGYRDGWNATAPPEYRY